MAYHEVLRSANSLGKEKQSQSGRWVYGDVGQGRNLVKKKKDEFRQGGINCM